MLALTLYLGQQKRTFIPPNQSKYLGTTVRPAVEVPKLRSLKVISASEYNRIDDKTKKKTWTRVYRFTYKALVQDLVKNWEKDFPKKDGWYQDSKPEEALILTRKIKNNSKIYEQSLLFNRGRLEYDPKSKQTAFAMPVRDPNWIWVSLNEQMILKKK